MTLTLAAAFILGTIATARATRLVIYDAYPPVEAARNAWIGWTGSGSPRRQAWAKLATCPFCASPYIAAVVLAVAIAGEVWSPDLTTVAGWWWTLAVWAAVSYLAAMLVVRDEPAE